MILSQGFRSTNQLPPARFQSNPDSLQSLILQVNSLVEYEPNPEFAGRNWNAGEIIEIVLRRRDGSFLPWNFILMVMCHEQAHIKVSFLTLSLAVLLLRN